MIDELKSKNSEELVSESIKKAKETNVEINSFVTIIDNPEHINNEESPLNGIPYAAKDLFSTKDILTTGSSNILANYVPFYDATVIKRLKDAGAILIGKTVCDEFGLGGTGTTGHTGVVKNPWDITRGAGGSSSGSATSVALGIVPFSLGTDTGDSVRKPASYCGVVGYKPTYGLIPRYGVLPFASSLDHVGLFTTCVKDAAIVTDAIKGFDGKDMTSLKTVESLASGLEGNISGKKLFYIKELTNIEYYDNPSEEVINTLSLFKENIAKIKELGVEVYEENLDEKIIDALGPAYTIISCAEATSNLSMYTGINFGMRGVGNNIKDMIKDHRTKGFSSLIKRRLVIGSYVLEEKNQERYYLNACRVRQLVIDKMNEFLSKYDALVMPASFKAPLLDAANDVITESKKDVASTLLIGNFGGYPSITIPCGFVDNMPVGLNLTGRVKGDKDLLNIAYGVEQKLGYAGQTVGGKHE